MASGSVYLFSRAPKSGVRIVAMGLMEMLKSQVGHVAYFKPIIATDAQEDEDIAFFRKYVPLRQPAEEAYGMRLETFEAYAEKDMVHTAYERIMERYVALQKRYDFIVCDGMADIESHFFVSWELDLEIARNLAIPLLPVYSAKGQDDADAIVEACRVLVESLHKRGAVIAALIAGRIDPNLHEAVCRHRLDVPFFCLPEVEELNLPVIAEIAAAIGAKVLTKNRDMLDRSVRQSKVAAMLPEHYLHYLEEGDLIIVPGDRTDIAMATFLANLSRNHPTIAGLLFTGGMAPPEAIDRLIEGAGLPVLPMLLTNTDTLTAALAVKHVDAKITQMSPRKIALAVGLFNRHIDTKLLESRLHLQPTQTMTPVRFIYSLYAKARRSKKRILLPESDDERVLRAAETVLRRGLCDITLLGNPQKVRQFAGTLGLDISKAQIVDPETFEARDRFARKFYALRKHKGVILPMAYEYMSRISYFATMMLHEGYVDGLVSGATHTTRETIKPAFEIIKTAPGVRLVSSLFFMLLEDRVLVYGDCAVNPDPDARDLAEIAVCSAHTAEKFGITPRVAMLSYSSGKSGVGSDVEKVREATKIAQKLAPDIPIEGPMQYDAAIDPEVAKKKMPGSKVAGRATVFIFPDLNTGNNTYKAVQRSSNAVAIGPVLQGLKKPVNDLSRGCLVEDIVYTIAITAIQAQETVS